MWPRFNLLAKLLLSYILVLLCPVVVILFFYYPYSTDIVKAKEMDWNEHITGQVMNSMDIFVRYVYRLPAELAANREIKMYMAKEDDYQRIVIAREMRKYNATDAFIDNTLLYVKDIGYLFSKTGSAYSLEDLGRPGVGYYYENWPLDDMIAQLNALTAPVVRPAEEVVVPGNNRVRMVTFLLPLPLGGNRSPGTVMILVREETIIRLMKSVSETYNGDFFILDANNRPLVALHPAGYAGTPAFRQLAAGLSGRGSAIRRLDDRSFMVSHAVSDLNGWKYVSLLPVTESLQGIRTIQRNTAMLVGLVLLLEFILIYVSIRNNYRPIDGLVRFIRHTFAPAGPRSMNEIETIRYALDELAAANSRLDERMKRTLPVMRDKLLIELAGGHYSSWDAFRQEAAAYGLAFRHPLVTAAVLSCEAGDDAIDRAEAWMRAKEGELPEGMDGYVCKSIYRQELVFLCSHKPDVSPKAVLGTWQRELESETGICALIGIGSPESAHTPEGFHLSYLQAARTAEALRIRKRERILVFDELEAPRHGTVSYFADLLQSLELAIWKNDVHGVEAVMERILDYIGSDGMPPHLVRTVYLSTAGVILNGLQRFRHDDRHLLRLADAMFQHRYTFGQMVAILRESCGKLCDMIRSTLPPARTASKSDMVAYIERYGMDPNFSLQQIADHFGMSPSNFSHHFKRTMGQNFKEYVDRMRIQQSVRLLRQTDDTLDAIARQVGYASTSSFIRAFKKSVGLTPGQFREAGERIF